jgi:hypothetical protein
MENLNTWESRFWLMTASKRSNSLSLGRRSAKLVPRYASFRQRPTVCAAGISRRQGNSHVAGEPLRKGVVL